MDENLLVDNLIGPDAVFPNMSVFIKEFYNKTRKEMYDQSSFTSEQFRATQENMDTLAKEMADKTEHKLYELK